jgi:heat shock protein HslJ
MFELEDGALVERGSEELSQISLDDLNDTTWRLLNLNGDQEPSLPDVEVTLHIKDSLLNGSAGCNEYRSTINSGAEWLNSLEIGPMATTQKACADDVMAQEMAYLSRLETAGAWWFDAGRLALSYPLDDGEFGILLFESMAGAQE